MLVLESATASLFGIRGGKSVFLVHLHHSIDGVGDILWRQRNNLPRCVIDAIVLQRGRSFV